jgi:hypothetical protein
MYICTHAYHIDIREREREREREKERARPKAGIEALLTGGTVTNETPFIQAIHQRFHHVPPLHALQL